MVEKKPQKYNWKLLDPTQTVVGNFVLPTEVVELVDAECVKESAVHDGLRVTRAHMLKTLLQEALGARGVL